MGERRGRLARGGWLALVWMLVFGAGAVLRAQDANAILRQAVETELRANKDDRSRWRFRDAQKDDDKHAGGAVSIVVQTDAGSVKRLMERGGHALTAEEARAEQERMEALIHDPARLEKQRKDGAADDKSATELLKMLPEAFTWRLVNSAGESYTLAFAPNPAFHPPSMEARVMGQMGGEMVIDKRQHRIATLRGRLTQDVTIGFGVLGRLKQGGTFLVERREIKPGLWQITETHVHIDGKALLFKTIGQQEDEVQTEFTEVPNGTTLERAVELSKTLH